jgi:tRNA (guanine37-N1)-methyltransferase
MENLKRPHLKIKKEKAQTFINYIKHMFESSSVLTNRFKTKQQENYILFPLNKEHPNYKAIKNQLDEDLDCEIIEIRAIKNPSYKPQSLEEALKQKIPNALLELVPSSYDVIGKIAIVELNQFNSLEKANAIKRSVAKAIMKVNSNVKTVYEKGSEIEGRFRLRQLKFLAGKKTSVTVHKENNCAFKLDVQETFFSPRLNFERQRVSKTDIKRGECIVDLFAGVGPFSIQIARVNDVNVYAFDINPKAIKYLKKNITLNELKGSIYPYNKNVKDLLNPTDSLGASLQQNVDRIIMNLPKRSLDFVDLVAKLAKEEGCIIHNYQFCSKPQSIQKAIQNLKKRLNLFKLGLAEVKQARVVKSYSPSEDMIGIDALLKNVEST